MDDGEMTADVRPRMAVVGVDPGARWTACVLRLGDYAVTGWTLGPVDSAGQPDAKALDEVDDLDALGRYVDRLVDRLNSTVDEAFRLADAVRVGVESIRVPSGWRHGRPSRVQLSDWLIPRSVVVGVRTAFPDVRLVLPGGNGRPRDDYPAELRRRRPPGWGPNEAPRGERDHERSAYDVAGRALAMP